MSYQTLIAKKENYIGTISINRLAELNTVSTQLAKDLNNAFLEMNQDLEVRVIIFKGEGRAFCAGIDLSEFEGKTHHELVDWVKPIIAQVHKIAVANGMALASAADIVVASDDTKFGLTAVNVGLSCMGPAATLVRNMPRKKIVEMLLTGADYNDIQIANKIKLEKEVIKTGLLVDAEKNAVEILTAYLGELGFRNVSVSFIGE